jgi:hypothetical protein
MVLLVQQVVKVRMDPLDPLDPTAPMEPLVPLDLLVLKAALEFKAQPVLEVRKEHQA